MYRMSSYRPCSRASLPHHEVCMCLQDDTAALVREMSQQMAELLKANRELREENEYLRKIY